MWKFVLACLVPVVYILLAASCSNEESMHKPELNKKLVSNNETIRKLEQKKEMAQTREQRDAISGIQKTYRKYKRHTVSALRCSDLILTADRNVTIIGKIAEYGIKVPYHTLAFIEVAECAAKAPVADEEFIVLAKRIIKPWGTGKVLELAKLVAEAQNEAELTAVRRKF